MKVKQKFQSVGQKPWKNLVVDIVRAYPKGTKFTYDKVRSDATLAGVPPPKHPNAWGGAMSAAAGDGFIIRTGLFTPSVNKASHRRMMAEWLRL